MDNTAPRTAWPCGHKRGTFLELVDSDFDIVCHKCLGHFFQYAYVPYLAFVALFTTIYFWRPLPLAVLLSFALLLFVLCYVGAALRNRPGRLVLAFAVLIPVGVILLDVPANATTLPASLDSCTSSALLALTLVLLLSFIKGLTRVPALRALHKASTWVVSLIVLSLILTIGAMATDFAVRMIPELSKFPAMLKTREWLEEAQRFRLALVCLAVAVGFVWSLAISISVAREDENANRRIEGPIWWEIHRVLVFFVRVLGHTVTELWKVFRDSLRRLWLIASDSVRVLFLVMATGGLVLATNLLARHMTAIWERDELLPTWESALGIALGVLAVWLPTWLIILIAIFHHPLHTWPGFKGDLSHGFIVLRYCLLISTFVYWFYFSLVLLGSWLLIDTLQFAFVVPHRFSIGGLSLAYSVIALLAAIILWVRQTREASPNSADRADGNRKKRGSRRSSA
ncbi:MAG TPA: hypothetical protein VF173_14100 [Thermoanaerobaculia bacterium]|nr:hypothetical protein [Thermoanaerobaculia bacterium]